MLDLCFDLNNPVQTRINDSSIHHGRILRNLLRLLDATCGDSFYEVLPRGVQLWVPAKSLGLYPDVLVVAGAPLLDQGRSDRVMNPCLVFEILSEPTPAYDPMEANLGERSRIFTHCRTIPYLQEYVFIHQQEARIEQFYRAQENVWGLTAQSGFDSVVELNVTNARLPLMDVYDRVEFVTRV
jgi:Uma2 family endonuclease